MNFKQKYKSGYHVILKVANSLKCNIIIEYIYSSDCSRDEEIKSAKINFNLSGDECFTYISHLEDITLINENNDVMIFEMEATKRMADEVIVKQFALIKESGKIVELPPNYSKKHDKLDISYLYVTDDYVPIYKL